LPARHLLTSSLVVAFDAALVSLGWQFGLWLRFDGAVPVLFDKTCDALTLSVVFVHLACFLVLGLHRRVWKYADASDLTRLAVAQSLAATGVWVLVYWAEGAAYPRGAVLIAELCIAILVTGLRLLIRLSVDAPSMRARQGSRVLIVGGGEAGRLIAHELRRHPELNTVPVAFADDDPAKKGMYVAGLPVLADKGNLCRVVEEKGVDQIIVAMPSASRQAVSEWVRLCARTKATLRMLPGLYELIAGKVDLQQLRDVRPEDLLGREPTRLDSNAATRYVEGRRILVTGAGGSIGSELCKQLARMRPDLLVLLGNEENQLHDLAVDLQLEQPQARHEIILADVRDEVRIRQVLLHFKPHLVFHTAAHKHVLLLETNVEEAVKNNVFGTRNVCLAAVEAGVEIFVYVSTDKAVRPSSVMGATKRIGEMIAQSMNDVGRTKFLVVRFGNVLRQW